MGTTAPASSRGAHPVVGGFVSAGGVMVELVGVERRYPGPPEVLALRDATFTLDAGEYVALTGASGSGKSTLLNVLGLLTQPTAGTYRLRGQDVGGLDEPDRAGVRAHWVGTVFQAFHLLTDRTALENVEFGALYTGHTLTGRVLRERATESLERVGLAHRLHASPSTLSGGERQRVAIARALLMQPALLLCDEPTGNLDSTATASVLDLFDELHHQGQTLLVVTHAPEVAARAHRQLHMRDGIVTPTPITPTPVTAVAPAAPGWATP